MEITVKDRQSLFDIAIQYLGSVEGVWLLAEKNNISITDELEDGTILKYDSTDIIDTKVAEHYAQERVSPATDIDDKELNTLLYGGEGIGYWRVEKNFEIMENLNNGKLKMEN